MLQLVQLSYTALHLKQDSLYQDMICLSTTLYQFRIMQRTWKLLAIYLPMSA